MVSIRPIESSCPEDGSVGQDGPITLPFGRSFGHSQQSKALQRGDMICN